MSETDRQPKFDLETYRQFIRDASPYISLVIGRKIRPSEADTMTDEELKALALLVDSRVEELNKSRPPWRGGGN